MLPDVDDSAGAPALNITEDEIRKLGPGECFYWNENEDFTRDSWVKAELRSIQDLKKPPILFVEGTSSKITAKAWLRPTSFEYRESQPPIWGRLNNGIVVIEHGAAIQDEALYFSPADRFLKGGWYFLDTIATAYVVAEYVIERPWFSSLLRRRHRVLIEVGGKKHVVMRGLLPGMAHALRRLIVQECRRVRRGDGRGDLA